MVGTEITCSLDFVIIQVCHSGIILQTREGNKYIIATACVYLIVNVYVYLKG